MNVTQENDLIQSLKSMMNSYFDLHPSLTLNAFAGRANVPATTLRRLLKDEQKSEIAPHTVLNIVSYILKEKNLSVLLKRVESSIADFLRLHFGHFIFSSETRVYASDLNTVLKDQMKYFIYKLAANHSGTNWIEIVETFGSLGRKKTKEMIDEGFLIEDKDQINARDKNFSLDLMVAASHLPELVRFYKPESIAEGLNSFFSLSESLNRDAIQEIKALQREVVQKIHAIMSDPNKFGEIPYFTINLAETFLYEKEGELQ